VDLRLGFDGLYGLVQQKLKCDPRSGDYFLFVNQKRTSAKVLLWDGTGLCIYSKRLAKGRFACLWNGIPSAPLSLTSTELALFLEGSKLVGMLSLSPPEYHF
jgi:transposase